MTDPGQGPALLRLLAWLSPSFPVGSFSYSHGLERAVEDGSVASAEDLVEWIETLLCQGSAWNDAVLAAEGWRRAQGGGDLLELADLAAALAGSAERLTESRLQGAAFLKAARSWPLGASPALPDDCAYCVAVGATAGAHRLPLESMLAAFLHAFSSNLIQAAIRLGVIGQTEAMAALAGMEPLLVAGAGRAARSTLDDLGSAAIMSEIAAMNHETQHTRLFRS